VPVDWRGAAPTESHLAVRTTSHVHLIDLELRTTAHENDEPVIPSELLAISREMTGGGRHMDIAMSPWERTRGVGVSDDGTIWEFGMQNRDGVVYPRGRGQVAVSLEARLPRSFHRIDYGSTTFEANVLADQTARLLDLRVRHSTHLAALGAPQADAEAWPPIVSRW
jgi:hypothetical protein